LTTSSILPTFAVAFFRLPTSCQHEKPARTSSYLLYILTLLYQFRVNVFVRTQPCLLILNKNNAPHECGNPKYKAIALGWLSDERFPRHHRHQSAASLANRIAGAQKLLASVADAELHQLVCIVKAVALYTN
jgi:hypothetical protein